VSSSTFSFSLHLTRRDSDATGRSGPTQFLLAMAGTVLGGLLLMWGIATYMRPGFLDPEYAMWTAKQQMVASCQVGSTIVMGDSQAAADFLPAQLNNATDLALGGASPIEMYFMARRLMRCPTHPHLVLLSFSPSDLVWDGYYWSRTALFGFLTFADMEVVRRESLRLDDTSMYSSANVGDLNARFTNWLYAHHFPSYYVSSMFNGKIIGRLPEYRRLSQQVIAQNGQHLYGTGSGTTQPAGEADMTTFSVKPVANEYFDKLLALFQSAGTKVRFVQAPWSQVTCGGLHPAAIARYEAYLVQLTRRHPGFSVLGPPVLCYPDKLFGDPVHLNAVGAATFSSQLYQQLLQHVATGGTG
jgi:hypothetical protein